MGDDLIDIIRGARIDWPPDENDGKPSFCMPDSGHPSVGSSFPLKKERTAGGRCRKGSAGSSPSLKVPNPVIAYSWSEDFLRIHGSNRDRVLMAVRDAAKVLERKGVDPSAEQFYVATSIAKGWNLKPRQLSDGLKELAKAGCIAIKESRKGKHVRMTLIRKALS